MIEFYNQYINSDRAQSVEALHPAHRPGQERRVDGPDLGACQDAGCRRRGGPARPRTDLQARLTAAHHDETQELDNLRTYLLKDLRVVEAKIDAAIEAWKKLSKDHRSNGVVTDVAEVTSLNGTTPVRIEDIRPISSRAWPSRWARGPSETLASTRDLEPKL